MNRDLGLLIQSYLDGELTGRKARRVARWVEADAEAQALYGELAGTQAVLRSEVELARAVPDKREFYWSQLERRIAQVEREKAAQEAPLAGGWLAGWRRYAAPLVGAAFVLFLSVPAARYLMGDRGDPYFEHLAEVENPIDEIGSYSFRTESGNMFVVWLYERSSDLAEASDESRGVITQ